MHDQEKWLEAAAGLEQDILYLENALRAAEYQAGLELANDIERLKIAVAIYQKNAATGVRWPSPDDLFCISAACSTNMRRDFRLAF